MRTVAMIDMDGVCEAIRLVAAEEILTRFGRLAKDDIEEKAPGDLVTAADKAAEEALTRRLQALLPGSLVVGEEQCATDPSMIGALDGAEPVWIIDPIDGTHNFVSGSPRFTVLVTLAQHGESLASWTYAPFLGLMATAVRGGGARVDGRPVRAAAAPADLRLLDTVTSIPRWWSPQLRAQTHALCGKGVTLAFFDTSGLEYVALAAGRRDAMIISWEYPWDHAAGVLLHSEAGGAALAADGSPFRLSGGNRLPLVLAADHATAMAVHEAMSGHP